MPKAVYHKRATYDYTIDQGIICIVDLNEGMSVTNDAENVIQDFEDKGLLTLEQLVIYRDSMGNWDQLLVKAGGFAGFKPLGAQDKASAIMRVKQN